MTFLLPWDLLEAGERPIRQMIMTKAAESGTPWVSFFSPDQLLSLARDCGFADASYVSGRELIDRYVPGTGLSAEEFLVDST